MSLTAADELTIRKHLATRIAGVADAGYVIPAPIYFQDKADFWAQIDSLSANTLREVETRDIALCSISLLKRVDSRKEGCGDNPFVRLTYNFHFFRGYDYEREDESEIAPDDFLKRTLKSYNTFVAAVLDAWNEFLGQTPIPELPDGYDGSTGALTQPDFIEEMEPCRYIKKSPPEGHSADLQCQVEILIFNE